MAIPDNFVRKAIRRPDRAISWISTRLRMGYDEFVFSPNNSRYLFDHADDWELAIILDACRFDLGEQGARERSWLPKPERVVSPAGHSSGWLSRTFDKASNSQLAETSYVTANQHSASAIDSSVLKQCDEVWRYAWDPELECVPPRPVTDQAIRMLRNSTAERYIVHYMQPHLPPIVDNPEYELVGGFDPGVDWISGNPWVLAENGELDGEIVKKAYKDNLEPVLDEVEILLDNAPVSDVVITADHGNYLGEEGLWGHRHLYHTADPVRVVPWWEVTATDNKTHKPDTYKKTDSPIDREEQLKALGYR